MDRLVGFAMITDAERARAFYVDKLGLTAVEDNDFALVLRSGDNIIRLPKASRVNPAPHTVLGWECEDLATRTRELSNAGVTFLRYDGMPQDENGIWTAPGGGRVAWFQDPDGNVLSLSQYVHP